VVEISKIFNMLFFFRSHQILVSSKQLSHFKTIIIIIIIKAASAAAFRYRQF